MHDQPYGIAIVHTDKKAVKSYHLHVLLEHANPPGPHSQDPQGLHCRHL